MSNLNQRLGCPPHRVLILSRSPISSDPRVLNQISWLQSEGVEVDVIGFGLKPEALNGKFQSLSQPNLPVRIFCYLFFWGKSRFEIVVGKYLKLALKELNQNQFIYDHVLLNDLDFVPSVPTYFSNDSTLRDEINFHIDLHEYFPGILGTLKYRILFGRHNSWLLQELKKKKFKSYSAVSDEIARHYSQFLEIDSVLSVENVPRKFDLEETNSNETIEIVYHGNCDRSRGVYIAAEAIGKISEEYRLNLMLTGNAKEIRNLKKYISKKKYSNKVRFIDPVAVSDIVPEIAQYDLGLALFDARKNKSLELALPNKFFEYIQAGLGVIAGSSESMLRVCREYGLGIEVSEFSSISLADTLSSIDRSEVQRLKIGASTAAKVYQSDNVKEKFLSRFSKIGE